MENDHYFTIRFTSETTIHDDPPYGYLAKIEGAIICYDGETDDESLAGKVRMYYANVEGAEYDGESRYFVFDSESDDTERYYSVLFNKTGAFKESVLKATESDGLFRNVLIIDRLEILPEYRGKGLGLTCLYRCVKQYGHGCSVVAIYPFPLQFGIVDHVDSDKQWQERMRFDQFSDNENASLKKLERYYARLGFVKISRTGVMALDPDRMLTPFVKNDIKRGLKIKALLSISE